MTSKTTRGATSSAAALAIAACAALLAAITGCGNTHPADSGSDAGQDGGAVRGSPDASKDPISAGGTGGVTGTGGLRLGTGGATGAGGALGAGGVRAGIGGATGAGGGAAGVGGARAGVGGSPATADAGQPDAVVDMAPTSDAPGGDATRPDASTLICRQDEACTSGQSCETACAVETGQTLPTTTVCTCAPAGGRLALACVSIPCNRDAGADARVTTAVCPNGIRNEDDCDTRTDTICATPCMSQMQLRCVCVGRGGGGGARWMCGATSSCQP